MKRRDFIKQAAAGSITAAAVDAARRPARAAAKKSSFGRMIGVQIHPFSLYDEGIDKCPDTLQETAAVDTLFVYSHLFGADPFMPAECLASDHGIPVRPPASRKLPRTWVRHTPEPFESKLLKHPKQGKDDQYYGKDLFADLQEPLKKRNVRLVCRILEPRGPTYLNVILNGSRLLTVDLDGRPGQDACWNHPDNRSWWLATVEDLFRVYPLDGFMFGAERVGPLSRLLVRGETPTFFCRHCRDRANEQGIDARRLKAGYRELFELVSDLRQGKDHRDSGFTPRRGRPSPRSTRRRPDTRRRRRGKTGEP